MSFTVTRDSAGAVTISGSASVEGLSLSLNSVAASFVDEYVPPTPADEQAAPAGEQATPATAADASTAAAATDAAPAAATESLAPVAPYKCPQCGAGYDGPGVCENQHPPVEVVPVEQQAAAAAAVAGGAEPSAAAGPVWPDGADKPSQ